MRPLGRHDEIGDHVLGVSSGGCLITQHMLHKANETIADELIISPLVLCGERAKPLRNLESDLEPAGTNVEGIQAPERTQLIFGITKAFRDFERLHPERAQ